MGAPGKRGSAGGSFFRFSLRGVSIIRGGFCPGWYMLGRKIFRGSGHGGDEPTVRLRKGIKKVKNAVYKLHIPSKQACVSLCGEIGYDVRV